MKGRILLIGSIFAVLLLLLVSFNGIASANAVRNDLIQSIKKRIENNDWKPGDILDIKLLKDNIKDVTWFPGYFLFAIYSLIAMIVVFIGLFL